MPLRWLARSLYPPAASRRHRDPLLTRKRGIVSRETQRRACAHGGDSIVLRIGPATVAER